MKEGGLRSSDFLVLFQIGLLQFKAFEPDRTGGVTRLGNELAFIVGIEL